MSLPARFSSFFFSVAFRVLRAGGLELREAVPGCAAFLLLLPLVATGRAADTNSAREFRDAMTLHDRATASALAAENKRYLAALQPLLRHAQLEGDTETAARLTQAMTALTETEKSGVVSNSARDQCFGQWRITYTSGISPADLELQPDGTVLRDSRTAAIWDVKNGLLQITWDGMWHDQFELPVYNGLLRGHDKDNVAITLTRKQPGAAGAPAVLHLALQPDYVGTWELRYTPPKAGENVQYALDIRPDGTWTYDRDFSGTWVEQDDHLSLRFNDHPELLDRYELPIRDGEIHGRNQLGSRLVLGHKKAPSAPASSVPPPGASAVVAASGVKKPEFVGVWQEHFAPPTGKDAADWTTDIHADGTFTYSINGVSGTWQVQNDYLRLHFKDKPTSVEDRYDLPVHDGELHGRNEKGARLTLSHKAESSGGPAVAVPAPAYFGTRH